MRDGTRIGGEGEALQGDPDVVLSHVGVDDGCGASGRDGRARRSTGSPEDRTRCGASALSNQALERGRAAVEEAGRGHVVRHLVVGHAGGVAPVV